MSKPKQKCKLRIEEFTSIIPYSVIEQKLSKRELKKFEKFMNGQTMMLLPQQAGIYYCDLLRFLADMNNTTLYD